MLEYVCENERCKLAGKVQGVKKDAPADCANCGWSMTAKHR